MAERWPTCVQRAMVILVALLMAMCMFATTAYADDGGGADDGSVEYITVGDDTQPVKFLRGIVNAELNGLNSTSGLNASVEANAIMAPGSTLRQVWIMNQNLLQGFYNIIFGVGMGMTIAYFLIYLQRELAEGRWTTDALVRACVMLVAVCWIMANGFDLLCKFIDMGSALGQKLLQSETSYNVPVAAVGQDFIDDINGTTGKIWIIFTLIAAIFELAIPYFAMTIMMLIIQAQIYMRMGELFLRALFAPLAIGDLYGGGPNPAGIRYLRSFLACALQGVIIIGALFVYRMVSSGVASIDGALGILGNITIFFAVVGLVGKANTFAREICGVA